MLSRDLRYPVVFLDVGETLIGPRRSYGAVYAGVLARLGIERTDEDFERALQSTWREFDARIPPGVDRYREFEGGEDEYWTRFADHTLHRVLDGQATPDLVGRALPALRDAFVTSEAWHVYPEVPIVLDALDAAGVRLAVVSNWDSRLPALLDRLGLRARFEHLIVSHLEGIEKPDPRLFEIALDRAGARPEDVLHVGDRADLDLAGARAAGIAGVVVDRAGRHDGESWAIPDLSSLPDIVGGEGAVG
jgi:putative hydrolase of the HAD superfamily